MANQPYTTMYSAPYVPPLPTITRTETRRLSAPQAPVFSPYTNPYYAAPFNGAYVAPVKAQFSPSQQNTPAGGITPGIANNFQDFLGNERPGAPTIQNLVNAGAGPGLVTSLAGNGSVNTASTTGTGGGVPSWVWLAIGGFVFWKFFLGGKKRISFDPFAKKRSRRLRAH